MISFSPSNYKRKSSNIKSIILNHEEIMWSIRIADTQVLDKYRISHSKVLSLTPHMWLTLYIHLFQLYWTCQLSLKYFCLLNSTIQILRINASSTFQQL
jgi:hypothetical protein